MNLRQLEVFCRVAELGSVSAAAKDVLLSQPAVSKQVRTLERTLGVRLIERAPRGVILTEAGIVLHKHGLKVLDAARAARAEMSKVREERARIRFGVASGVFLIVTRLIRDLRGKQLPHIDLMTVVSNTGEILDQLASGRIDLALVWDPGRVPTLTMERLCAGEHALILSPTHPLAAQRAVSHADLQECSWILTPHGTPLRAYIERRLGTVGIYPRPEMEFGHAEVIKVAVEAGLGVSIMARATVTIEEQAGVLAARPIRGCTLSRDLYLVTRRTRDVPQAMKDVMRFLREHESVRRLSAPDRAAPPGASFDT